MRGGVTDARGDQGTIRVAETNPILGDCAAGRRRARRCGMVAGQAGGRDYSVGKERSGVVPASMMACGCKEIGENWAAQGGKWLRAFGEKYFRVGESARPGRTNGHYRRVA